MPRTLLTDIALPKITRASGTQTKVPVSHVALGDGNGANYDPQFEQTGLVRERVRKPIDRRHLIEPNVWRVKADFGPETDAFAVREMGFFDQDGDLIAIWAGLDVSPRETGVITYLVDHVLNFSRVENGILIVDAPDDELHDHKLSTNITFAFMSAEIIRLQRRAVESENARLIPQIQTMWRA